jgi:hypothetical protein
MESRVLARRNSKSHRRRIGALFGFLSLCVTITLSGCGNDYAIYGGNPDPEYVYIYSETPVYIEEEVPGDPAGEIWVDSFNQPNSVNGVDILWVIDTSGSMNTYSADLLLGIDAMLTALPASGWRLAMTSNDPAKAAVEAQFPLVPGDDIVNAESMYNAMGRGAREEGFDAAYEYIMNNPYASTWMRSDAALLVVFVSDEEDQSDDHFPIVQDFNNWYGGMRGGSVFASSIINVAQADSVCTNPPSAINIGDRYIEATNWFSGIIVDICADDWSAGVTDASVQVDPFEEWSLSYIPIESTIRVFIDTHLNADWTYDAASNSIQFTIIPPGGSHVEIGYIIDESTDTGDSGA